MEHEQTIPEQRKEEETAPESDTPGPVAEPAAAVAAAPRRRWGRTTLLIAGAAALGVLTGTVTGYAVQYHREPTALPPLAQQKLVTPKALAPDDATTNKTINANRWHKADDDLTKLLIEAPGGATVEATGYDSLDSYATYFEHPDRALRGMAGEVRRIASTGWVEGDRVFVEIRLLQFNDRSDAESTQRGYAAFMPTKEYAGNAGVAIPGVPSELGHVWVDSEAHEEPGYHPMWEGRAVARRGDIVMEILYVRNRGKVSENDVIELAKRQLERL